MPSPHCSLWLKSLRGNLPLKVAAKDLRYAEILRMVAHVAQQQVCVCSVTFAIYSRAGTTVDQVQNA